MIEEIIKILNDNRFYDSTQEGYIQLPFIFDSEFENVAKLIDLKIKERYEKALFS